MFAIIYTIHESLIRHNANQNAGTAFTTKTERVRSQGSLGNVLYNVLSRASEVAMYRSRDTSLTPSFTVIEPNVIPLVTLFPLYPYVALQVNSRSLTRIHVVGLSPGPFIALSASI